MRVIARQLSSKNCLAAFFVSRHQDASPGRLGIEFISEGVKWGMGWVVVGTAVSGRADFASFLWKNAIFSRVLAENQGAPTTAVPTTTHPTPYFMPPDRLACHSLLAKESSGA